MLHTNTILQGTLGLLNDLMAVPELSAFNLAGGTALALQIGHRISIDLDLFGVRPFEKEEILDLVSGLGHCVVIHQTRNILVFNINGVKVDFVNYKYPLLDEVRTIDGIRLIGLPDIAAMKLGAITGRGARRDFTDLFFLLKQYSLPEMLAFYNQKYPEGSELLVLRSLTYFDDAEEDKAPDMLQQTDWKEVKATIRKEVKAILT